MQRLLALAVLAFVVLIAAACGGDDDGDGDASSTTEWASSLCTAVSSWGDALTSAAESLKAGNISRDSLEGTADEVKGATETFVDDLRGLGRPDTDAGEQAESSVEQLTDELQQEVDKIEGAVDDASGASGVLTAVSTVSATLVTMGNQLTSTLGDLEQLDASGELKTAFEQSASCQELSGSLP
jgi:hypothetical protein